MKEIDEEYEGVQNFKSILVFFIERSFVLKKNHNNERLGR